MSKSAIPCDALLLAGGASRRMGRDKAMLPLADGRLLWQRQLGILREMRPERLFFSGPSRPGLPEDVICLQDSQPGLGPLAGLVEGLRAMRSPRLIVLAVDLPRMTAEFLGELLASCQPGGGAVPRRGEWYEPLAAVYPREALSQAETALAGEGRALQPLVRALRADGLMVEVPVRDEGLLVNWNEGAEPGGN